VHVGPSFVADEQSLEVVQPGERALDHPAIAAEPRAVLGVAAGDDRSNPSLTQQAPLVVRVVAAISDERVWSTARSPDSATHRRHRPHERDELLDIVSPGTRQAPGEQDARRIDDQVLLLRTRATDACIQTKTASPRAAPSAIEPSHLTSSRLGSSDSSATRPHVQSPRLAIGGRSPSEGLPVSDESSGSLA
jgi:hypothetical protein